MGKSGTLLKGTGTNSTMLPRLLEGKARTWRLARTILYGEPDSQSEYVDPPNGDIRIVISIIIVNVFHDIVFAH